MSTGVRRVLCALLLLVPSIAAADEPVPDSATIRAHVAQAAGPMAHAYRERFETTYSDGTTSIERFTRRDADYRAVEDTGPFHTESGVYKTQAWHQNDNGQTVLDRADPGLATHETLTTTVQRVDTPVHGYAVATLNAAGHGIRELVDAATWQVVRRENITPNGTIVTTFDDIRADHGRTFAHHRHVDDAVRHRSSDIRQTAYEPAEIADAEVTMPPPRRALVQFPAGAERVTLPTQFGPSHVYVRVMIGDRGLDFVLDTGASGITIDESVAKQLGLTMYQPHQAVTAGRYTTARTIVPEMHVGDLVMKNVAMQIIPQGRDASAGVKEVGLLGFDFLAELGVTIDYEHHAVTVTPEDRFVAPTDPRTIPLDVRIGNGQPMTTVTINGAVAERFILDTGGGGTFLIFDYFARRHPEALVDDGYAGARSRPMHFVGIGGDFATRPYAIKSLRLANVDFQDTIGYRVLSQGSYSGTTDGLIGTTFLRLFTLGIDYGNSRVYLTPNDDGRRAMGIR